MQRIERSQIANIFYEDGADKQEIYDSLKKELGIELDPDMDLEEQIDMVYKTYLDTLDKLDEEGAKRYAPKTSTGKIKLSRKDYIGELISKRKYTRETLIVQANEYFEYDAGKSSKGRVSRVIRELKQAGILVELEGGILGTSK